MLINIQLCQRTDINLEFILIRQSCCHFGIQAVNPFNYQHIVYPHLLWLRNVFLVSRLKIKSRKHYFFSIQQAKHTVMEQLDIYRLKTLEIILSIHISRCIFSFYKEIIYRDRMRHHAIYLKLYGQTMGKCCLTGR